MACEDFCEPAEEQPWLFDMGQVGRIGHYMAAALLEMAHVATHGARSALIVFAHHEIGGTEDSRQQGDQVQLRQGTVAEEIRDSPHMPK